MEQLFSGTENKLSSFKEKQKSALSSFECNRWPNLINVEVISRDSIILDSSKSIKKKTMMFKPQYLSSFDLMKRQKSWI